MIQSIESTKITRLVVVHDQAGRIIDNHNVSLYVDVQDDGRTLKVFCKKRREGGDIEQAEEPSES